jgi:adenylosuccinate synthase
MSPSSPLLRNSTAIVGLQWGDEGKGKLVDLLAREHDAVVRYNGGANAGHSVVVNNQRYKLHLVPSGILYPGKLAVIGNGVVVDPETLLKELEGLAQSGVDTGGLVISTHAHAVLPYHKAEDELREEMLRRGPDHGAAQTEIGTTRRGIGPAYADKIQRAGAVRVGDLLRPDILNKRVGVACAVKNPLFAASGKPIFEPSVVAEGALAAGQKLRPMIRDTTYLLHDLLGEGKRLLFEGANGTLLDVDHGTYPFVTGSNTGATGIHAGSGVPTANLGRVLGIMKAYSTRVGSGPMPTELFDEKGSRIRERGREYGTTTGRPRRVGWLDLVAVRYAAMVNGITGIAMTLLDVLAGFEHLPVCTQYEIRGERTERFPADAEDLASAKPIYQVLPGFPEEISEARRLADLPAGARKYIEFIENKTGVRIDIVSVGPGREQTILD